MSHALLHRPAPILRRRRSARQEPCSPTSSTPRARPSSSRTCPPSPTPSSTPSKPVPRRTWSSAPSACSPGTGSPTCARTSGIPFVLGHALYMKHDPRRQGQDRQDRRRQARRPCSAAACSRWPTSTRGPSGRPATCSAAARFFVRQRAQLIAHIVNTNSQFNLPPLSEEADLRRQPHRRPRRPLHRPEHQARRHRRPGPDRRLRRADRRAGAAPGPARQGRRPGHLRAAADGARASGRSSD